jgi:hypothetical protein
MTLTLDLSPELERQLAQEAAHRGQSVDACVRTLLEERLRLPSAERKLTPEERRDAVPDYRGLHRGSLRDLAELARQQGAPLSVDWDAMPEDLEPDADTCDELIAWLRDGRQDRPHAVRRRV